MPHHLPFLTVIETESRRFLECLAMTDPERPVPSCPGWSAADLLWHLAEVQNFWGTIVAGRMREPGVAAPVRPAAHADLLAMFDLNAQALVEALAGVEPAEEVWTWADDHSVAFVLRRQAHEALIHRVDAELAAGEPAGPAAAALAADGVDELLTLMVGGIPGWGEFAPDGTTAGIEVTDAAGAWTLALGRFRGTSPDTGKSYDEDAAEVSLDRAAAATVLRGSAWLVDRWLWGRAGDAVPAIEGDDAVAGRLRAIVTASTQ